MKSSNNVKNFLSGWGTIKHAVSLWSGLGPLLPPRTNTILTTIVFVASGDTSIIMPSQNDYFFPMSNIILSHMSKWFTANELAPNLDETNIMKFVTNHSQHYPLITDYNKKHLEDYINTKLLGLKTHNHMNWKNHIINQMSASQAEIYSCQHQNYRALHNEN
jgi:hypothetical protein